MRYVKLRGAMNNLRHMPSSIDINSTLNGSLIFDIFCYYKLFCRGDVTGESEPPICPLVPFKNVSFCLQQNFYYIYGQFNGKETQRVSLGCVAAFLRVQSENH